VGLEPPLQSEGRPAPDAGEPARGESRAGSTPSQLPSQIAAATTPDLPEFAKKADDLDAIKKAVEDAAAVSGALWFSYLFVLFYFAIAAGAVTHADLFLENPVKLPFLNVELPLRAFFFLAPILFLVVHAYVLVHLVMLADKARRFDQALHHQIGQKRGLAEDQSHRRAVIRGLLQRQLPSNIFVQFLAGHADIREGPFGWLLRGIAWSTLVIAPVLLLLMIQIQFLPYHSLSITWVHRLALVADMILIWWLWGRILSGREIDGFPSFWKSFTRNAFALALSASVVLFATLSATFPNEWQESHFTRLDQLEVPVSIHDLVFNSTVNDVTRHRALLSSTLVLTGFNIYEGLKIDDPDKVRGRDFIFRARGRDLNGAIFDLANMPKVDLEGAELQNASLFQTKLQGTNFKRAYLEEAMLTGAFLQGATLVSAKLRGAYLNGAQLQGASLDYADLRGASLFYAQAQGASFYYAQLQGADLGTAGLEGAFLVDAFLQGASLGQAQLQGASLFGAQLQGAELNETVLKANDLSHAYLWRTNLAAPSAVSDIIFPDEPETWLPSWWGEEDTVQQWNEKAYVDLHQMIESLPQSYERDQTLERVQSLNCANLNPTLASCDLSVPPPTEATKWRKSLEDARVDEAAYTKSLASELKALVCSGGDNAIYVLRGIQSDDVRTRALLSLVVDLRSRLEAAGPEAPALADFIMSKGCPVSTFLTDADRARLLQIKREQEAVQKVGK
jgi:uncharacterized protein YjbI with pentapeptide repeats